MTFKYEIDAIVLVDGTYELEQLTGWCFENIGKFGPWYFEYWLYKNCWRFGFNNAEDATAFKLRFG